MQRNAYFDNAKFILIFFVVFGHLLQSFMEQHQLINQLYLFIYSFHMPAFILISGYFAKGIYEKGYITKLFKKLLIPYMIFQFIYTIYYYFLLDHSTLTVDFFNPQWSLWFLISLFFWNVMILLFKKLPTYIALCIAFTIGLLVGYIDWIDHYLSLSRTFVFFPFFLFGYFLTNKHFKKIYSKQFKLIAALILISSFLLIYFLPTINELWFFGSQPYDQLENIQVMAIVKRIGVYCINLIMIASFFAFIPQNEYFFTNWGKNTLYVYLLHGFIIRLFRVTGIENYLSSTEAIVLLLIGAFLITSLLSSKIVVTLAQPVIELSTSKVKKLKKERLQLS